MLTWCAISMTGKIVIKLQLIDQAEVSLKFELDCMISISNEINKKQGNVQLYVV